MMMDMRQLIASMEDTLKLQNRARAQRRADEAERDKKEFQEKLMRAAANKMELEELASKIKGSDDAVQRDQLISLMTPVSGPF
ncbi:MAG: hypothetical protein K2O97_11775 [Acetatifactor sp.]|nr:hypothetical protein [Acetatifactor sp.]MDE7045666.1 hypothetical protein [Acetatifactor sp.]